MKLKILIAVLTIFLELVTSQQAQCRDYVLVSIRGTYEGQGPSIGFFGMINQTLLTLPNGVEYDAVYPAAPNQTAYLGAEDVVRYINAGIQTCPDQKYAILGYSQGASAAALALVNYTDPGSAFYKAVAAVLVIGNPYHKPGEEVNVDQNGTDSTRQCVGALYNNTNNSTRQAIPNIWYDNGRLIDICFQGDIVCCPSWPDANFSPNHLLYTATPSVQDIGAKFLIERLQANGTSGGTNGTGTDNGDGGGSGGPSQTTTGGNGPASTLPGAASTIMATNSLAALFIAVIFSSLLNMIS